jgi:hypothetical protein
MYHSTFHEDTRLSLAGSSLLDGHICVHAVRSRRVFIFLGIARIGLWASVLCCMHGSGLDVEIKCPLPSTLSLGLTE